MTPQDKAKELVDKMKSSLFSDGEYDANQCALIAVDEIIKSTYWQYLIDGIDYWQEVKREINKINKL